MARTFTKPPMSMRAVRALSRRRLLQFAALGGLGGASGWLPQLASAAAADPQRRRSCILLWMTGGPSQTDTFDMKPGHENGGQFKPIATSVPGVEICEHLPQVAQVMQHLAPIRSMSTKEGDHSRGTYLLRTGYRSQGPIHYPTMGSLLSKELAREESELPDYVSVSPYKFLSPAAYGPGFLGPQHAPLGQRCSAAAESKAAEPWAAPARTARPWRTGPSPRPT